MDSIPVTPPTSALEALGRAATDALTDGMVDRLAVTGAHGLELLDRLNDEETRAAVHHTLDALTSMHRTGQLDTVLEVVALAQAARAALTDGMVERLCQFIEVMVTNLATPEIAELARETEGAFHDAAKECAGNPSKTLFGVIRELSKPETLRMISLMLAFGRSLEARSKHFAGGMSGPPQ
jgi:uncharacterized protein YjgD (DUF1641 family)